MLPGPAREGPEPGGRHPESYERAGEPPSAQELHADSAANRAREAPATAPAGMRTSATIATRDGITLRSEGMVS